MPLTEEQHDRTTVQEKYTWNLTDVYPDVAAWRADKARLTAEVPQVGAFAGRLGSSPQTLADALEVMTRLDRELMRLYVYASMLSDEDTRRSEPQGMQQEMQQLHAEFSAQASYIQPEILRVGGATIEAFIDAEPRLAPYAVMLRDIARRAAHTLSDAEEKILADAQPLAGSASTIYGILADADFPYPTITLSDGRSVKVDQAGYAEVRTSANRQDRRVAMSAFFDALGDFRRTFGATMNSSVQKALFYAKARKYTSTVEASLDRANIPVSVYMRLIDGVGRHLPALHRYVDLRRRMIGVTDDLHYYDLYAPLVASVNLRYTPEEAQRRVVEAMEPLGQEYVSVLERSFRERWLDWYPAEGKRSGAYSNGAAYDVHPYMLLNYLGQFNDVSTLAHELGHTMHSYYSNRTQPYPTADYSTFVAEVASTFNEALLIDYMLKQIKDGPTRLSLLGSYLESIKATVFRQTQFAEFELRMHEMGTGVKAGYRRRARRAVSQHHQTVLRPRPAHRCCGRRCGQRVELHPTFLHRVLRLPVRHVLHGGRSARRQGHRGRLVRNGSLPRVPGIGQLEVSDRPAEGGGRRHDHRRAARPDHADDEPRHGRNRRASAQTVGQRRRPP